LEEQILRFYLKVFSFIFLVLIYFVYILFIKDISLKNNDIIIKKNQNYVDIIDKNFNENQFNKLLYKFIIKFLLLSDMKIHYGKFNINDGSNYFLILKSISSPSKYINKITIIEGSSKKELKERLEVFFKNYKIPEYSKVIADTYYINYGSSFEELDKQFKKNYIKVINNYKDHKLLEFFSIEEIFVIGSLLEKEGKGYLDKKKIFSVIINRIKKEMKLQIDATVIFALTKGNKELLRKLTLKDLKIKDEFNTYYIYGLPPSPISYVGLETIELIFENYKTNYLFYFYNALENNHVFSENYEEHLFKLNEYRAKK